MRATTRSYPCWLCLVAIVLSASRALAQEAPALLRLPDGRMEFFEVSPELQQIGRAVCAMITKDQFQAAGRPPFTLMSTSLEASLQAQLNTQLPFCGGTRNQMQKSQPVAACCTATLIAPNIVVTAAHCFRDDMGNFPCDDVDRDTSANLLQNFFFVFDYHMVDANTNPVTFDQSQVYTGVAILGRELARNQLNCQNNRNALDWAVVMLDRNVTGRTPVTVATTTAQTNQNVFAIGFGGGLPMKFSMGGVVTGQVEDGFQIDNLEIAGGNSGGPIFDLATRALLAVLSADEATAPANDFIIDQTSQCIRPAQCPGDAVCSPGQTLVCRVTVPAFAAAIQQAIMGTTTPPGMTNMACGVGACGMGAGGALPMILLGLVWMKLSSPARRVHRGKHDRFWSRNMVNPTRVDTQPSSGSRLASQEPEKMSR